MTQFTDDNQIQLLRNGQEYFPALKDAIDRAQYEVYLQTYIFEADATGISIAKALKSAAQRGALVKVLLDGFGCKDLPKEFINDLQTAGVKIMLYRPNISPWTFKKSRLRRLHRKVVVVDRKVAFVGGINIIDDFDIPNHAPNNVPPRIDYAVRIEGTLLPTIAASADKLWRRIAWMHLQPIQINPISNTPKHTIQNGMRAAFILRDNLRHRRDIEDAYLTEINAAKTEILIANAYFVPGRRFRQALLAAAKRGVKVKLLLQGRMEYFLMFATHAFYSQFLKNNIEIYEYRKSFMHCKVAIIDRYWVTVGSSNIDPFSLFLAYEANVMIQDTSFAQTLYADVASHIAQGAHPILPYEWQTRNKLQRIASWLAYGFVRGFLGIIGQSNEH
ncbi:MAG: cardiolipin synthase ClsB [Methylophilus sp.]|nr:cardiolipin synthase ClsB [Methylophilus sp.]